MLSPRDNFSGSGGTYLESRIPRYMARHTNLHKCSRYVEVDRKCNWIALHNDSVAFGVIESKLHIFCMLHIWVSCCKLLHTSFSIHKTIFHYKGSKLFSMSIQQLECTQILGSILIILLFFFFLRGGGLVFCAYNRWPSETPFDHYTALDCPEIFDLLVACFFANST